MSRASMATYCSHSASVMPRRFVTRVARIYSSAPRDIALTVSRATSSVVSPIRTMAVAFASRTVAILVKARAKRAGGKSFSSGSMILITPSIAARCDSSLTKFGEKNPRTPRVFSAAKPAKRPPKYNTPSKAPLRIIPSINMARSAAASGLSILNVSDTVSGEIRRPVLPSVDITASAKDAPIEPPRTVPNRDRRDPSPVSCANRPTPTALRPRRSAPRAGKPKVSRSVTRPSAPSSSRSGTRRSSSLSSRIAPSVIRPPTCWKMLLPT